MKTDFQTKRQEIDNAYTKKKQQLEEQLSVLAEEKRNFSNYIDESAEKIRHTANKREYDTSMGYQQLEKAQHEEQLITQKMRNDLENHLEDNQVSYQKDIQSYENDCYTQQKELR